MENKNYETVKPRTFLKSLGKKRLPKENSTEREKLSQSGGVSAGAIISIEPAASQNSSTKRKRSHSLAISTIISNEVSPSNRLTVPEESTRSESNNNNSPIVSSKAKLERRISDTGVTAAKKTATFSLPENENSRPKLRRQSTRAHLTEEGKEQVRIHAEDVLKRVNNDQPQPPNQKPDTLLEGRPRSFSHNLIPMEKQEERHQEKSKLINSHKKGRSEINYKKEDNEEVHHAILSDSDAADFKKVSNKTEEEGESFFSKLRTRSFKPKPTHEIYSTSHHKQEPHINREENNIIGEIKFNASRDRSIRRSISLEHVPEKQLKSAIKERTSEYKKDNLKFALSPEEEIRQENSDNRGRPKLRRQNTKPLLKDEDRERILAHAEQVLRREKTESPSETSNRNDSSPSESRTNNSNDLFPKFSKNWKKSPSSLSPYLGHQYNTNNPTKSTRTKSTNDKPVMQKIKTEHSERKSNFLIRPSRRVTSPHQNSYRKSGDDVSFIKKKTSPRLHTKAKFESESSKSLLSQSPHLIRADTPPNELQMPKSDPTSPLTPSRNRGSSKGKADKTDFGVSLEVSVKDRISFIENLSSKAEQVMQKRKSEKGPRGDKILKQKSEKIISKSEHKKEIKISLLKTDTKRRLRMTSPRPSQRQLNFETPTDQDTKKLRRSISMENIDPYVISTPTEPSKVLPKAIGRQSKRKVNNKSGEESLLKEKGKINSSPQINSGDEHHHHHHHHHHPRDRDALRKKSHIELDLVVPTDSQNFSLNISHFDLLKTEKVKKSKRLKPTQQPQPDNEASAVVVENNEEQSTDTPHNNKGNPMWSLLPLLLSERKSKNDTDRRERKSARHKKEETPPPLNPSPPSPPTSPKPLPSPLPSCIQKKKHDDNTKQPTNL